MNKNLLTIISSCILAFCAFTGARADTGAAPEFVRGASQSLQVCQNSSATPLNNLLTVLDTDPAETLTWTLLTTPNHGTAAISYNAPTNTDTVVPSGTTYMPSAGYSGIDSFSVQVDDGFLYDTIMIYVTVTALPVADPIAGAMEVCTGATITLTGPGSGDWYAANGNATVSGGAVMGVTAGVDTILYVVTNMCAADTAALQVTVNEAPATAGTITGAAEVCVGANISLTSSVTGGSWSNNDVLGTINSSGMLIGNNTGTDTVVYTVTNGCGTAAAYHVVTVNPLPDAGTISGYDSVCVGASIVLTSSVPGGVWSSSIPDFASVNASGTVTGGLNGSTVISYTVTNGCGTASASYNVRVNVPAGPIIGSATICQFQLGTYIDGVAGGTWSSNDITKALPLFGGNFLGGLTGSATIFYTVNNACGETTAEMDVEVIDCSTIGVNSVAAPAVSVVLVPNPSQGSFTLTIPAAVGGEAHLYIANMVGAQVMQRPINTNTPTELSLDVPAGIYTVTAIVGQDRYTQRLVISK